MTKTNVFFENVDVSVGASSSVTAAAAAALTSLVAGNAQAQAAAHNTGALPKLIRWAGPFIPCCTTDI